VCGGKQCSKARKLNINKKGEEEKEGLGREIITWEQETGTSVSFHVVWEEGRKREKRGGG
jgi:hypothetical protein